MAGVAEFLSSALPRGPLMWLLVLEYWVKATPSHGVLSCS
jgi:hypothetical protein